MVQIHQAFERKKLWSSKIRVLFCIYSLIVERVVSIHIVRVQFPVGAKFLGRIQFRDEQMRETSHPFRVWDAGNSSVRSSLMHMRRNSNVLMER